MIAEKFEVLETLLESEHFVSYYGDMYCVKDSCDGCPYQDGCQTEEGQIETGRDYPVLSLRRAIGFGKIHDAEPYKLEIKNEEYDDFSFSNGRYRSNLSESGYLPDQNVKGLYKQLPEMPTEEPTEYMLYSEEDKTYYCVRQVCKLCEHNETCKPVIMIRPKDMVMLATDVRSQEPCLFTIASKEPAWIANLQNVALKADPNLLMYIDELFQTHPELITDITKDKTYWSFLSHKYFFDKSELYDFNVAVMKHIRLNTDKTKQVLIDFIEYLVDEYREFKTNLKAKQKKK